MTISDVVQSGLFEGDSEDQQQLIRIPIRADESNGSKRRRRSRHQDLPSERSLLLWSTDEHDRFLEALELYPSGPWKIIADHVGTRTTRQTMTHAQKYRQKIERRKLKENRDSIESAESSSQDSSSHTREASMPEPMTTPVFDATEHTVLLEFLDNFHPSEIDHDEPLPYTQDGGFLLEVDDFECNTSMETSLGTRYS
ncbi:Myb-like DNA-binding domain [Phytophthora infestans]|uniref:Myb-like DNA-binding domain n=1 Tax=Phytophthora infestans TaxID=4787 RepID=A0A833W5S0_PHYIN|nr:Myb-like DNA-binding domain [Phytophthora infestans]KAF4131311.1 Myb-like DNA-binding domain [Phytophthora infestans]